MAFCLIRIENENKDQQCLYPKKKGLTFIASNPLLLFVAEDGEISNQFVQDFLDFCNIPWDDNLAEREDSLFK